MKHLKMNGTLSYKFAVFEILRDFCIIIYCMSVLSQHIECTDSVIVVSYQDCIYTHAHTCTHTISPLKHIHTTHTSHSPTSDAPPWESRTTSGCLWMGFFHSYHRTTQNSPRTFVFKSARVNCMNVLQEFHFHLRGQVTLQ